MVLYEVNINIKKEAYSEYYQWLHGHIKEMLLFPGFIEAKLFNEQLEINAQERKIVVHYYIDELKNLNDYFNNNSKNMRGQANDLFKDKFSISRRVLNMVANE